MTKGKIALNISNAVRYEKGIREGYTCTFCSNETNLDDSMSSRGWNLICCKCVHKMANALNSSPGELCGMIQSEGQRIAQWFDEDINEEDPDDSV